MDGHRPHAVGAEKGAPLRAQDALGSADAFLREHAQPPGRSVEAEVAENRREGADELEALGHVARLAEEELEAIGHEDLPEARRDDAGPVARILDEACGDGVRDQVRELFEDVIGVGR